MCGGTLCLHASCLVHKLVSHHLTSSGSSDALLRSLAKEDYLSMMVVEQQRMKVSTKLVSITEVSDEVIYENN
jgi:hypothetical protein